MQKKIFFCFLLNLQLLYTSSNDFCSTHSEEVITSDGASYTIRFHYSLLKNLDCTCSQNHDLGWLYASNNNETEIDVRINESSLKGTLTTIISLPCYMADNKKKSMLTECLIKESSARTAYLFKLERYTQSLVKLFSEQAKTIEKKDKSLAQKTQQNIQLHDECVQLRNENEALKLEILTLKQQQQPNIALSKN